MAREVRKTWPEGKTIMMPRKLLKKWLAALRSGEYKQAAGGLYETILGGPQNGQKGFCCLGVLSKECGIPLGKLQGKGFPELAWLDKHRVYFRTGQEETAEDTLLCDNPALGAGHEPGAYASASHYNDDGKYSFNMIADMIERCAVALEDRDRLL